MKFKVQKLILHYTVYKMRCELFYTTWDFFSYAIYIFYQSCVKTKTLKFNVSYVKKVYFSLNTILLDHKIVLPKKVYSKECSN